MLNKYEKFLNSNYEACFGDIPMKLNGSYKFEKINNDMIYFKISINTGYNLIKKELCDSKNKIKNELQSFIENYFTNIEKYELDVLYETAEYLIKDTDEIDMYSYIKKNIVLEFENTTLYEILIEKYPSEIKQITNIFIFIYRNILDDYIKL